MAVLVEAGLFESGSVWQNCTGHFHEFARFPAFSSAGVAPSGPVLIVQRKA